MAVVVTVAALGVYNIARAYGAFAGGELVAALGLTVLLAVVARWAGLRATDLGLGRSAMRPGVRLGGLVAGVFAVAVVVAALVPATRGFLDDSRGDVSGGRLLATLITGVLLTTVAPEEFAFRGVLLGAGSRAWNVRTAWIGSALLFGLWHIAPTLHTVTGDNALHANGSREAFVVAGTVAATAAAGAGFAWLRLRSSSLLAPVVAHFAINSCALVGAWVVRG